jgi:hypothetical protein
MKHDSSASRKVHPVCLPKPLAVVESNANNTTQASGVDNKQAASVLRAKIHLVKGTSAHVLTPEKDMQMHTSTRAVAPRRVARQSWFYASDWYAIPLCLIWVFGYFFVADSYHQNTNGSSSGITHVLFQVADTCLRIGEAVVRWVFSA